MKHALHAYNMTQHIFKQQSTWDIIKKTLEALKCVLNLHASFRNVCFIFILLSTCMKTVTRVEL